MDWQLNVLLLWVLMPFVYAWSPISSTHSRSFYSSPSQQKEQTHQRQFHQQHHQQQRNSISPYLDLALCPLRSQPWSCARERSARLLDIWDGELHVQWQNLKVEADRQLNATLEKRGYSDTATLSKEKPSTILKKIEIGTNYMKKYLAETMDGFLGREYDYLDNTKTNDVNEEETADEEYNEDEESEEVEEDEEEEEEEVEEEEEEKGGQQNGYSANEQTGGLKNTNEIIKNTNNFNQESSDSDVEFVELAEDNSEEDEDDDELKKPGGGNKRRRKNKNKNKNKKGSQHEIATQAANLLVIQPLEHQLASQHHDNQVEAHAAATQLLKPLKQKFKPLKQKKRKRKKGGHGGATSTIIVEQEPATDHLGLGLLEELAEWDGDVGGKRKKKYPMKYGRSNGVTRGKKKKKKKAIVKFMLLGTFLKAKIELLLKLLGAHLQIKFFAVALIGLLINIARFWIDLKRGGQPQKVVYVEHAHHQHHYDDHGEDWSESGGGYWKRSLQTDSTENTYDTVTDSYQPRQPHQLQYQQQEQQQLQHQQYDPQYLAYRNKWQRK